MCRNWLSKKKCHWMIFSFAVRIHFYRLVLRVRTQSAQLCMSAAAVAVAWCLVCRHKCGMRRILKSWLRWGVGCIDKSGESCWFNTVRIGSDLRAQHWWNAVAHGWRWSGQCGRWYFDLGWVMCYDVSYLQDKPSVGWFHNWVVRSCSGFSLERQMKFEKLLQRKNVLRFWKRGNVSNKHHFWKKKI